MIQSLPMIQSLLMIQHQTIKIQLRNNKMKGRGANE